MFNSLKKYFKKQPKQSAVDRTKTDLQLEFEQAFNNKTEQDLLTRTTYKLDTTSAAYLLAFPYTNIPAYYDFQKFKQTLFEQLMRQKYNEQEVVGALKNNPEEFFTRGWCYPDARAIRPKNAGKESGENALSFYRWHLLLPAEFWKKPENMDLFAKAAQHYWNANVDMFVAQKPNITQLTAMHSHILGFEKALKHIRLGYVNQFAAQHDCLASNLRLASDDEEHTHITEQIQQNNNTLNQYRKINLDFDALKKLQSAAQTIATTPTLEK